MMHVWLMLVDGDRDGRSLSIILHADCTGQAHSRLTNTREYKEYINNCSSVRIESKVLGNVGPLQYWGETYHVIK